MGKTAIALTMAANISIRKKIPAAFFSLEMPAEALMLRLVSGEARIDSHKLRTGFFSSGDQPSLWEAMANIREAPLYFVDIKDMRVMDIRVMARRLREREKVEIIFIDYLGLIAPENIRTPKPRWEQISEVSRSLKNLARELKIPVVALSQLTREADKEKEPGLANIRDSGSIEQDADVVMILHRDRELNKTAEEQSQSAGQEIELMIAKNRNGMVGKVKLVFLKQFTKFVNFIADQTQGPS
jgi:replicative DNA helicase